MCGTGWGLGLALRASKRCLRSLTTRFIKGVSSQACEGNSNEAWIAWKALLSGGISALNVGNTSSVARSNLRIGFTHYKAQVY